MDTTHATDLAGGLQQPTELLAAVCPSEQSITRDVAFDLELLVNDH
jgi:hypothetical protein